MSKHVMITTHLSWDSVEEKIETFLAAQPSAQVVSVFKNGEKMGSVYTN